jgi:hypothetical protein
VRPALLLAVLAALVVTADAEAQTYEIVAVPGLELADLENVDTRHAAVGLLVPANGPETSGPQARAALVRGAVESSHLGGFPEGEPRVVFVEGGKMRLENAVFDPADVRIVLGLPAGGPEPNDRRYPIVVRGNGFAGLLTSDSTRIPGLVSIADVAPTALGEDGLTSRRAADPLAELAALDERIDSHVDARLLSTLAAGVAALLWAFLLPRGGIVGVVVGLGLNLVAGLAEVGGWSAVPLLGLGTLALTPLVARALATELRLGLACAGILAAYLGAMAADASIVALSPWGPEQAGRFFGITNLPETILLVPALAGAAFFGRTLGLAGFAGVALLAVVTISSARFGADGGGAIVLGVSFAVLAVLLAERAPTWLAPALVAAGAVVVAFAWIDRALGGSSHVTSAAEEGPGGVLGDIVRRVRISWDHATGEWYTALLVAACIVALVILAVVVTRSPIAQSAKALPLAFAAGVFTSLVVNDSPTHVAAAGLFGFAVLWIGTLAPHASPPTARRAGNPARDRRSGRGLRWRRDGRAPA